MPAFPAFARLDVTPTDLGSWTALGLLLREQRRLRRADQRRSPDRALSPFASLRRRARASSLR